MHGLLAICRVELAVTGFCTVLPVSLSAEERIWEFQKMWKGSIVL